MSIKCSTEPSQSWGLELYYSAFSWALGSGSTELPMRRRTLLPESDVGHNLTFEISIYTLDLHKRPMLPCDFTYVIGNYNANRVSCAYCSTRAHLWCLSSASCYAYSWLVLKSLWVKYLFSISLFGDAQQKNKHTTKNCSLVNVSCRCFRLSMMVDILWGSL